MLGGEGVGAWLGSLAAGAALGLCIVAALRLGILPEPPGGGLWPVSQLNASVGPVWVPMFAVAARVTWLGIRALRTRQGRGVLGARVRPELSQLAPLFAALGLAGTVWGLGRAFDALDSGDFLSRLPALLSGLGAAMTSTLVGLGLQIATLLLAAFNPGYSLVRIAPAGGELHVELDRIPLGRGLPGLGRALDALCVQKPEGLAVQLHPRIPEDDRRALLAALWQRTEGGVPLREVSP